MHRDRRALLLGLAAVLLWSTVATAFKVALRYLDVFQLVFYASVTSALALLVAVAARGQIAELGSEFRRSPRYYLAMAALNPCLYYVVLLFAYAAARRDPVFMLGQGPNAFIYLRNIMIVKAEKRRLASAQDAAPSSNT